MAFHHLLLYIFSFHCAGVGWTVFTCQTTLLVSASFCMCIMLQTLGLGLDFRNYACKLKATLKIVPA